MFFIILPAVHVIKFQGARPIKIDKQNFNEFTFKCGRAIFINQFGEPGNILKNII